MKPFFSRTGTKRNLDAARAAEWGILVSPAGEWRDEGFDLVGADNGQWSERDSLGPFDAGRFNRFVEWLGARAQWLVLPDIVCGGLASLELTLTWLDRLRGHPSILLIAVQDGMTQAMIAPFLGPKVGIFVGGSTEWKEATITSWGRLAAAAGAYLHVGRVNSARRIRLCAQGGAHSFDGTSVTMYADTLPHLDNAAREASRQTDLELFIAARSVHTPHGFARRCREIVARMPGHAAHRQLDLLTNEIMAGLGFGDGIDIFEAAVSKWHREGLPYPPQHEGGPL